MDVCDAVAAPPNEPTRKECTCSSSNCAQPALHLNLPVCLLYHINAEAGSNNNNNNACKVCLLMFSLLLSHINCIVLYLFQQQQQDVCYLLQCRAGVQTVRLLPRLVFVVVVVVVITLLLYSFLVCLV